MKKTIQFILFFTLSMTLIGCNSIEEQKAESLIKKYYQAMIDQDYEKAFEQLYPYDEFYMDGTTMSQAEAKEFYLKKIDLLKVQKYKLKDFGIVEVEYEDGHSFWYHIKLVTEQDGQDSEQFEVAYVFEGKLMLENSDDIYRN